MTLLEDTDIEAYLFYGICNLYKNTRKTDYLICIISNVFTYIFKCRSIVTLHKTKGITYFESRKLKLENKGDISITCYVEMFLSNNIHSDIWHCSKINVTMHNVK
jgi:hypothetical protein